MTKINVCSENYLNRNGRWLFPLWASLILLLSPAILEIVGGASPIPMWLTNILAALGFGLSGFFAIFVDTFSAHVVRWLAEVIALAILGVVFWNYVNTVV